MRDMVARGPIALSVLLLFLMSAWQPEAVTAAATPRMVVVVGPTELREEVQVAGKGRRVMLPGQVSDVAVDPSGNLFMADNFVSARPSDVRCQVRERVAATGAIRIVAGALPRFQGRTGAERLVLSGCQSLAVDAADNVYVLSTRFPYGHHPLQIFRIGGGSGTVRAVAGRTRCYGLHSGRPATESSVDYVGDLAINPVGDVLLSHEYTGGIWSLSPRGIVKQLATNVCRYPPHSFTCPQAIAPSSDGKIYFAGERDRRVVEAINPATGKASVVAGGGPCRVNRYFFYGNGGLARRAKLAGARDIAADRGGNLFIADGGVVQRVDTKTHRIEILAGNGKLAAEPARVRTGESFRALATAIEPRALTVGPRGTVFIADGGAGAVLELPGR